MLGTTPDRENIMTQHADEFTALLTAKPSRQGTPLGRIVAGVFLGMLAWSAFCAIVAVVLLFTVLRGISDSGSAGVTDSNLPAPGSGTLSQACEDAYVNGDDLTVPCAGDNPALVKELTGN